MRRYEILAFLGGFIQLVSGYTKEFMSGVFKEFPFEGSMYKYYYWELINLEGQLLGCLFWATAIWLKVEHRFAKKAMQWFIDFIIVDMYFVYSKNPYILDDYKVICFGLSTLIFLIVCFIKDPLIFIFKRKK